MNRLEVCCTRSADHRPPIRALELFCGVGGYSLALEAVTDQPTEVTAIDNNATALDAYEATFGKRPIQTNVEYIKPSAVEGYDLWCMSPPCQPYTQTSLSLQLGAEDPRATAFHHVCELLRSTPVPPKYVLLENVMAFLSSQSLARILAVLTERGFQWQVETACISYFKELRRTAYASPAEDRSCLQIFLLTPLMFGVPNRRPRVFLVAASASSDAPAAHPELCGRVVVVPPAVAASGGVAMHDVAFPLPPAAAQPADEFHDSCLSAMEAASHLWEPRRKLSEYLDASLLADHVHRTCTHQWECEACEEQLQALAPHLVDPTRMLKFHRVLDVTTGSSAHTNCFTKGYRKNYFAAGSLFASDDFARDFCEESHDGRLLISEDGRSRLAEQDSASMSACDQVASHLRWFTSAEAAALLGYPQWYSFPDKLTENQRCALLGNGLSIQCTQAVLHYLLHDFFATTGDEDQPKL